MKIAITGCPGSGKSTLSKSLHALLKIPLYHLDQYFWKPGWQRPDRAEFEKKHNELCDKDSWIIEGMAIRHFDYRAKQADIIIFLDLPLWFCFYRILKRAITGFGKVRDSSAKECPEQLPSWEFLVYVWNFNKKYREYLESLFEQYKNQKKIFIVKNDKEAAELVQKFASGTF